MASDVAWCICRQVGERSYESRTVGEHDLKARPGSSDVVRSEVVCKPAHDKRTTRKDAGGDQERAAVLDEMAIRGDEHDVSYDSYRATHQHEYAAPVELIRQIACQEDHKECSSIWRNSEKLGLDSLISEA